MKGVREVRQTGLSESQLVMSISNEQLGDFDIHFSKTYSNVEASCGFVNNDILLRLAGDSLGGDVEIRMPVHDADKLWALIDDILKRAKGLKSRGML